MKGKSEVTGQMQTIMGYPYISLLSIQSVAIALVSLHLLTLKDRSDVTFLPSLYGDNTQHACKNPFLCSINVAPVNGEVDVEDLVVTSGILIDYGCLYQ